MSIFTPNLLGRSFIEARMTDQCVITRSPDGVEADTIDPVTGALAVPSGEQVIVYTGKVLIQAFYLPETANVADVEGFFQLIEHVRVLLPITVTNIQNGDYINVVVAPNDPRLIGRPLRVMSVQMGTRRTYRAVLARDLYYQAKTQD